jgi:hypothetical protein
MTPRNTNTGGVLEAMILPAWNVAGTPTKNMKIDRRMCDEMSNDIWLAAARTSSVAR